ncbi:MAG: FAD-dependent oxidoreductase, partial [Bacteroidota bacterium]
VSENYDGKSILSVYMSPENAFDNEFIQQTDERLIQNAYNTLNKYYPDFEKDVINYDIQRFKYAFPIFEPNYGEKIEILRNDKSVNGPIFLAGDYMVYATVDGAIISARNAVERVSQYLRDK